MKDWNQLPRVLKRRLCLTYLAGAVAAAVSLVVYLAAGDRVILILGSILSLCCMHWGRSCRTLLAAKEYETAEGLCTGITPLPFQRCRKIHLLSENGAEITLLLDRNARIHIGTPYRFYFQKSTHPPIGNAYLDASLSTGSFLGHEELQAEAFPSFETTKK